MHKTIEAVRGRLGRFFKRLGSKDSGLPLSMRLFFMSLWLDLTPLYGGNVQPGVFSGASFIGLRTITADSSLLLAAATGRRLLGFEASPTTVGTSGHAGRILVGASTQVSTTNRLSQFELATGQKIMEWFGPGGIDVSLTGVTIDWVSGTFDVTLYYVDVA